MDKGLISGLNLIDYHKAFDLIDHATLLKKLALYRVSGRSLQWFDSYLKDPKQKVMIQRQLWSPQSITASVPQGLILSPLLSYFSSMTCHWKSAEALSKCMHLSM